MSGPNSVPPATSTPTTVAPTQKRSCCPSMCICIPSIILALGISLAAATQWQGQITAVVTTVSLPVAAAIITTVSLVALLTLCCCKRKAKQENNGTAVVTAAELAQAARTESEGKALSALSSAYNHVDLHDLSPLEKAITHAEKAQQKLQSNKLTASISRAREVQAKCESVQKAITALESLYTTCQCIGTISPAEIANRFPQQPSLTEIKSHLQLLLSSFSADTPPYKKIHGHIAEITVIQDYSEIYLKIEKLLKITAPHLKKKASKDLEECLLALEPIEKKLAHCSPSLTKKVTEELTIKKSQIANAAKGIKDDQKTRILKELKERNLKESKGVTLWYGLALTQHNIHQLQDQDLPLTTEQEAAIRKGEGELKEHLDSLTLNDNEKNLFTKLVSGKDCFSLHTHGSKVSRTIDTVGKQLALFFLNNENNTEKLINVLNALQIKYPKVWVTINKNKDFSSLIGLFYEVALKQESQTLKKLINENPINPTQPTLLKKRADEIRTAREEFEKVYGKAALLHVYYSIYIDLFNATRRYVPTMKGTISEDLYKLYLFLSTCPILTEINKRQLDESNGTYSIKWAIGLLEGSIPTNMQRASKKDLLTTAKDSKITKDSAKAVFNIYQEFIDTERDAIERLQLLPLINQDFSEHLNKTIVTHTLQAITKSLTTTESAALKVANVDFDKLLEDAILKGDQLTDSNLNQLQSFASTDRIELVLKPLKKARMLLKSFHDLAQAAEAGLTAVAQFQQKLSSERLQALLTANKRNEILKIIYDCFSSEEMHSYASRLQGLATKSFELSQLATTLGLDEFLKSNNPKLQDLLRQKKCTGQTFQGITANGFQRPPRWILLMKDLYTNIGGDPKQQEAFMQAIKLGADSTNIVLQLDAILKSIMEPPK